MPYIVKRGEVHDGDDRYGIGVELPEGVGDEAMVEAGAITWVNPTAEKARKTAQANANARAEAGMTKLPRHPKAVK